MGAASSSGQAGAGAGAEAATGPAEAAASTFKIDEAFKGMDRTRELLTSIELPSTLPSKDDLIKLYNAPLCKRDGAPFKLPVHPALYKILSHRPDSHALVEPDYQSQAWALSVAASAALHPDTPLHSELGDELSVAGHVDELFGRIISIANNAMPKSAALARKRNRSDASITQSLARPDFLMFLQDTLLFKGEDKAQDSSWKAVRSDLGSKVSRWSEVYHGQLEYLLCYGAVGFAFQMHYLSRDDRVVHELSSALDTKRTGHKIAVIHAAIITQHILNLQASALRLAGVQPRSLEREVTRDDGSKVVISDTHVAKTVPRKVFLEYGAKVEHLQQLYKAVKDSQYVVHAVHGPKLTRALYSVYLEPVGTQVQECGPPASELKTAIRCILLGLKRIHSAGMGHGDLRWQNIITGPYNPSQGFADFCIIDLELAQRLGQPPTLHQFMPTAWEDGAVLVDGRFEASSDLHMMGKMLAVAIDAQAQVEKADLAQDLVGKLISKALTVDGALKHKWLKQK